MTSLSKLSLKYRLLITVPVISAVAWTCISVYNYTQIRENIHGLSDKNVAQWMERYRELIVDDIRIGDYLRVWNETSGLIEDDIFKAVYILSNDDRVLVKYPLDASAASSLGSIKESDPGAIVSDGFYYYPITDRYGTQWGKVFIKPASDKSLKIINTAMGKFVLFGLGMLLLELAAIIWLLHIMFRPIEYVTSEIARLTRGYKEGDIDVEGLNALVEDLPEGEVKQLGRQLVTFAESISGYQEQTAQTAALAAIGEISAQVAHDMRSPLSVLNAFVQHYETCGDSDEREFAGAAHRSVKKLLHMADDFLDYGKAKILNRTPCNLKQVFYEFVEPECSKVLRDKGLAIDLNIDPHLYANIDSHKISRTMTNLVQNAVRAVEKQKGRIEVGAMEGRSGELIIIVSDNGCGIPKADLEKIYESFYSTDKKLGTGLGLSYCKQVVEVHDGTIDVQSDVNKGTIFTIMLPDCVVSESEVLASVSADTAAGNVVVNKRTGVPGPEKVLIVDDDDGIRMQWKRLIDQKGGRIVYSASSVKEAQSSLGVDYTMIDTAIVDYEYAGEEQNGVDLVSFLKRNGVRTVYLCTGYYRDEEICRRAKEAGAESVLSKPIDDKEVTAIFS